MTSRNISHLLLAFLLITLMAAGCIKTHPADKPNILFIFIDDLGWTAPSCYGNEHVQTVNIDRLASEGMKFTDAYVTPQCTPSRAALLTGQHTARNRMWHVIPYYDFPYARLKEPKYVENLPRETYTLGKALQDNGYTTALLGKWHLTHNQDGYYTYLFDSVKHYYGFDYVNPMTDPTEYQSYGDKGVNFLTGEALKFMENQKDHPFFIYLSHHTIHGPVLAPDSLISKYLQLGYPEEGLNNATYLAAIEHIDHSVGNLLDKLDELRIADKTVVIFLTDNGGVDRFYSNAPLRYGKGTVYEGGIRVPFLIRWPGKIDPGIVSSFPVHVTDFFPTLVDLAGGTLRDEAILDGISLVPVLLESTDTPHTPTNEERGTMNDERPLFWYCPLYDVLWGATPAAVVRKGKYKLIRFFGDYVDREQDNKYIPEGRVELYDLESDIGERHDLSEKLPEVSNEMLELLNNWLTEMEVELPTLNPDFNMDKALQRGNSSK